MSTRTMLIGTLASVCLLGQAVVQASPPGQHAPRSHSAPVLSGRVRPLSAYLAQGLTPTEAVLSRHADQLVRAGVPRTAVMAAMKSSSLSSTTGSGSAALALTSALEPLGDLNSDGVRDVLELRYGTPNSKGVSRLTMFARKGSNGDVLWSRAVSVAKDHFVVPAGIPTGKDSRPGVVLFDDSVSSSSDGKTLTVTMALTGLDAAGRSLPWTHHESGTVTVGDDGVSEKHLPTLVGLTRATSVARDVVLSLTDASTDSDGTQTSTVTPLRVSTADGATVLLGSPVQASGGVTDVAIAGDVSGDQLGDVVLVSPGSPGVVETRAGTDGHALWRNTELTLNDGAAAEPVGDVHPSAPDHPQVGEVAVSTGLPTTSAAALGGLAVPNPLAPSHGQVALLDGADGTTVWSKTGDMPYAVTHAGAHLVPAVGVLTSETSTANSTVTETLTLATFDVDGNQVYSHDYSVSTPESSDSNDVSSGIGIAVPIGDVDADTAADALALLFVFSGKSVNSKTLLLHGKDGSPLTDTTAQPLGASTTGHGDDLVHVTTKRGVTVNVRRGSNDQTLFTTLVPSSTDVTSAAAFATVLYGRRCADVLVEGAGKRAGLVAVLASNGQPRWTLHYVSGSSAPGTLERPKATPNPRCA